MPRKHREGHSEGGDHASHLLPIKLKVVWPQLDVDSAPHPRVRFRVSGLLTQAELPERVNGPFGWRPRQWWPLRTLPLPERLVMVRSAEARSASLAARPASC